jgi:hypothetical protein
LSSTVGEGRFTKIVKNMIVLPPYQKSVIVGILLSDGYLGSAKPHENPNLRFKQSLKNSKYVLFVFSILSHYCNKSPFIVKSNRNDKETFSLCLQTRGLPCFSELRSIFYINNVKTVPADIYNLLTPVALAHLIMGDGVAKPHGLIICTDSYNLVDIVRLMNVLLIKYNIESNLRFHTPTQPRIYIRQHSMPILRRLITPYMEKSMLYKIEEVIKIQFEKDPKIIVTNLETEEITKFVTLKEAALELKVSHTTVASYIKNNKLLLNKYMIKINNKK